MEPSVVSWGSEDLEGANIVDDLDSYLQEINDRLTISRMVSDSVIKGMVNAIMEESALRIARAEGEAESLKERLRVYETGGGKIGDSGVLRLSSSVAECDRVDERLRSLIMFVEEQFQLRKRDVDESKGSLVVGKVNKLSGSLGQNELNEYAKWSRFDQNLNILKNIVNAVFDEVGNVVSLSKASHYEWQKEREFQGEIEDMVIRNSVRGFQDELKGKLLEQSALFYGGHKKKQLGKMKQLSGLRQDLDALSRSLSSPEIVQLPPHMSHEDVEGWGKDKKKDHFHCKALNNHLSPPNSIREVNGNDGTAKNISLENPDPGQLKHMSKDDLIAYFKHEMTEMKRNHESFVQQLIEDYYSLKREYLRETGRSSSVKKDKEFEALRKKIPDVIVTLDDILIENEKLSLVHENDEIVDSLRCRIDSLASANYELKEVVKHKGKEVEFLSSQLSIAVEEMSSSKAYLSEQMEKLECDLQDAKMEVSIRESIYGCSVRGLIDKIECCMEDMNIESLAMLEFFQIVFTEAVKDSLDSMQGGVNDSDMEFILMQELLGVILEGIADAAISLWKKKYEEELEHKVSLQASVSKMQNALRLEVEEKEKLNRKMLLYSSLVEEKNKLQNILLKENERFELMNLDYSRFRDQVKRQEIINDNNSRELNLLNSKLKAIIEEKEGTLALFKAKEIAHRKEIESIIVSVGRLLKLISEFEIKAVKAVENNNMRIEKLKSECNPLVQKANSFTRMELVNKERLGRKLSDLKKAEAEVDLLGDEVDVLLGLLEKIYIALDHYAPILQHYPGIMEILKLIRRELSSDVGKSVC